jgi:predicted kinase
MTFVLQMAGESGSGKSTVARAVGKATGAVVIDKDDITGPLIEEGVLEPGGGGPGYAVVFRLAETAMEQGFSVILDNPGFWEAIIDRGRQLAERHDAAYRVVRCHCPDRDAQKTRLSGPGRQAGQPQNLAELEASISRPGVMLVPKEPHLEVDTTRPLETCVAQVLEYLP